uniref:Uncharacterized protein n=1 Tax=Cacopsylla melanoneura TaxID=428564 RepID=A0A8D8VS62_9HEMI
MQSQSNWILLVLCYFQSKGTFGARTFSPWELKDVWFKMEQKNKEKFNFDSIVREQLEKERQELAYDENGEVKLIRHTYTTHKSTTFYGPYYMYKGKVYKRKSYTKEPTVRSNVYVTRKSFSRRNITPALTKKYFPQYKPWSSTSYMNKSTFYGPYYMYKGKYPTVDWTNSFQDLGFMQEIRNKHQQEWTLEMLRFSFDPNYSTTPIVRPPWIPHSEVERYYA